MDRNLEQQLFTKYPKIFHLRDIDTPNGWYDLLDSLCLFLQKDTDICKKPQVEIIQIKNKFGRLRIYYNTTGEPTIEERASINAAIDFAEWHSSRICCICGISNCRSCKHD